MTFAEYAGKGKQDRRSGRIGAFLFTLSGSVGFAYQRSAGLNIMAFLKKIYLAFVVGFALVPAAYSMNINERVQALQQQGWKVGLSVLDVNNKVTSINGDARFPLDSTVKAIACANVLSKVDENTLSLDKAILITKQDVITYSPVVEQYIEKQLTLRQACEAATAYSDNTAANVAISEGGGPNGLTAFMRSIGDEKTRSDRYEPDLTINPEHDLRDTTTANAINASLKKLLTGDILTEGSKSQLKAWMMGNRVADNMLRAVLPAGWQIADRSGASDYGIRGITSMAWSDKHPPVFISIYVRKNGTTLDQRSAVIRMLGGHIFNEIIEQ